MRPDDAERGVPLFMEQLIDSLRPGQVDYRSDGREELTNTYPAKISRTAALHGVKLKRQGYTVDQVVQLYEDLCQAVIEVAIEQKISFDSDDFRILDGCLDNAMACAVAAFGVSTQETTSDPRLRRRGASEDLE